MTSSNRTGVRRPTLASSDRRDLLELEQLRLEVLEAQRRTARPWRASLWEVAKYLVVAVPVLLSVAAFFYDNYRAREIRDSELELKREELKLKREELAEKERAALAFGFDRLKGLPEAAMLYLALYPERSTTVILGMVRVEPPGDSATEWPWPATSSAALEALKRIGTERLSDADRAYLSSLTDQSDAYYERWLSTPDQATAPPVLASTRIKKSILLLLGDAQGAQETDQRIREIENY